jgi:amino acid permease
MAAEVLYIPATTDDMPRFLARTNRHGAPMPALIMAAGLISLLLVALLFAADARAKSHAGDMVIAAAATPRESTSFSCRASCTRRLRLCTSRRDENGI